MKTKIFIVILVSSVSINIFSQENNTEIKPDPFYNGHLSKYYNPQKVDFSSEYHNALLNSKLNNELNEYALYNSDLVWLTPNSQQNGVIGRNYQRIQIHIDKVSKSVEKYNLYYVSGKSKVNNNICSFFGTIELIHLVCSECDYEDSLRCGSLTGKYIFYEDSIQNHSGVFKGIMNCSVSIDEEHKRIILDESMDVADGYHNRTFVGTWTDYKTGISKKCIWGDYCLPYTFDFDQGDGEMIVNDKYVRYGWQSYNDGTEYINTGKDKWELKEKWWELNFPHKN